jgi:hypothetical protein
VAKYCQHMHGGYRGRGEGRGTQGIWNGGRVNANNRSISSTTVGGCCNSMSQQRGGVYSTVGGSCEVLMDPEAK